MDERDIIISVTVIIADRPYPLKIRRSEEDKVREAAKRINDKIREYQLGYSGKDKQDYLAMASLNLTMEMIHQKHAAPVVAISPDISTQLAAIEHILSSVVD
jgi:cell division protein ZapA (FtsZ GTPase activity inhibitor)